MKQKFKYLFLFLLAVVFSTLKAQAPPWIWANGAASTGAEFIQGVSVDKVTGDVYAGGNFNGNLSAVYGSTFNATLGGTDAILVKYNTSGVLQYALRIGGTSTDAAQAVFLNPSENCVYIAGYFRNTVDFDPSAATFNLTSTGLDDIFIAKYTAAGAFVWAIRAGSTGNDRAEGIYADANGVYITGYCQNTTTFRSTNATTASSSGTHTGNNSFLAKYSLAVKRSG